VDPAGAGWSGAAEQLHDLFMDLVRLGGMLQPDAAVPGQPVSVSQAFALHELDTGTPLSQRDLAERLRLEKSSVSRMAADMERKGLLVRERDPDNRRTYRLRLTEEGRTLHARMASAFHAHYLRWVAAMTGAEREALVTGLSAFVRVLREGPVLWDLHAEAREGAAAPAALPAQPARTPRT
jgi:DNA-binding MarR family transcriptional regulator